MRRYEMSLSGGVKLLSAVVSALVLAVPLLVWGVVPGIRLSPGAEVARWAVAVLPLVILVSWGLSPKAIELEGGELRILRRAWRAAGYRLAEVEVVTPLPPRWLLGAVRTFGNGGLFGFYGWYFKGGPFRLFATRSRDLVEVRVGGRRVVVSPDEPERFVEGLLAAAPRARRGQAAGGAASASTRS